MWRRRGGTYRAPFVIIWAGPSMKFTVCGLHAKACADGRIFRDCGGRLWRTTPGQVHQSLTMPPMPRMTTEQARSVVAAGMTGAGGTREAEAAIAPSSTHPMRQALLAPGAADASGGPTDSRLFQPPKQGRIALRRNGRAMYGNYNATFSRGTCKIREHATSEVHRRALRHLCNHSPATAILLEDERNHV